MAWIALSISVLSVFLTLFFRVKNTQMFTALAAAKASEAQMKQVLADIIDDDGNVRGRLALPGEVPTDEATLQLQRSTKETEEMLRQAIQLRHDLDVERKNNKQLENIVEIINDKSVVQIRLPGKKVMPNRTPCGGLCNMASWDKESQIWRCLINQGMNVDNSRHLFLDANNQCVMFEKKIRK